MGIHLLATPTLLKKLGQETVENNGSLNKKKKETVNLDFENLPKKRELGFRCDARIKTVPRSELWESLDNSRDEIHLCLFKDNGGVVS